MAGRNAKPISLHMAGGNPSHLTKAEIARREKSEIKIGDNKLRCPDFVKKDPIANKKWREVIKIYKDVDFVSSGDVGLLARYCMSFGEYQNLLSIRNNLAMLDFAAEELEEARDAFDAELTERQKQKLFNKIDYIISADGLLTIETAINKKMDMLIKMEDRLFLNPLAKIKNIPKQPGEDTKINKFSKFQKGIG